MQQRRHSKRSSPRPSPRQAPRPPAPDKQQASDEEGRWRLDRVVRERFALSWNKARERIERGKIWVAGAPVLDISLLVAPDAELDFVPHAPLPRPHEPRLPADAIRAVDRDIVVVEKPAGLLTVPYAPGDRDTLQRLLPLALARQERQEGGPRGPKQAKRQEHPPRLHVVHRLDRSTSGLLVFARTALAQSHLKDQFRAHSALRRYLALVEGHAPATTITSHLVRDRGDGRRGSVERAPARLRDKLGEGKLAITHVEVVERLTDATLIACRLETGRTNQIRIHLAELGHPLLGETIYLQANTSHPAARRLCLHAAELGFVHPRSGDTLNFCSELPAEMRAEIDAHR